MFAYSSGFKPAHSARALVTRTAAFAALLGLAGCASDPYTTAQHVSPQVVAQATEMEDDGLPVQTAPSARVRMAPDDPSEPFSRNYGGSNPSAVRKEAKPEEHYEQVPADRAPVPQQAMKLPLPGDLPDDLPADFRKKLVHAMAEAE
jgi:hypothetical protein